MNIQPGDSSAQIPDIRPSGIPGLNREVHLFGDSGKVMTVFWPFQPTDFDKLEGLGFSSLADLKKTAASTGRMIRMQDMGPPDANDVRPRPALDRQRPSGPVGAATGGPAKP